MALASSFEDLEIWQIARKLVNLVYDDFKSCRDFNFNKQVQSAALSVMNNISEGFSRSSKRQFHHFLDISNGSTGEVKSMYYVAEDRNYVSKKIAQERRQLCDLEKRKIGSMMNKFVARCPCVSVSLYHSITVSRCPCITVSQYHGITVSQYRTVSQYHGITVSQYHGIVSITVSQYHGITVSQYHGITVSQYHSITVSQYHGITVSQIN